MTNRINLAKTLILLSNVKGVKIAELAGIKNPNYYNWIANKPKALSENSVEKLFEVLGVTNGKLNSLKIHRWFESSHVAENINNALLQLNLSNKHEFENSKVFQIRTTNNLQFSLINIISNKESFLLLCFNASPRVIEFPIDAKKLGFGRDVFLSTPLSVEIYNKWSQSLSYLDMQSFLVDAKSHLPELNLTEFNTIQFSKNQVNVSNPIQISDEINILKATNEGLKAIIRELLKEIRSNSPKSKFLKDEERKAIFDMFYKHEMEKLTKPIDY